MVGIMATREYTVEKSAINAARLDMSLRGVLGGFYYGLQHDAANGLLHVLVDTAATAQQLQAARDVVIAHDPGTLDADQAALAALKSDPWWRQDKAAWYADLAAMTAAERDTEIAQKLILVRAALRVLWSAVNEG